MSQLFFRLISDPTGMYIYLLARRTLQCEIFDMDFLKISSGYNFLIIEEPLSHAYEQDKRIDVGISVNEKKIQEK